MKRHESDRYRAMFRSGTAYLMNDCDTLEEMREEIDRVNKRAVKRGYDEDQFIIVHIEHYAWYSDGGTFIKSETYETAVETYPKEIE